MLMIQPSPSPSALLSFSPRYHKEMDAHRLKIKNASTHGDGNAE